MTLLFTIIAFIIALGILITFHEFGHYLVARWSGVKVLRFSIGFGQPLFKKRLGKDQTEWVLAAIPLGGYVKMLDEREGEVAPKDLPRSFNRQPVGRRFAIVAAGPIANFLLAILFYWLLFIIGVTGMKPILGPVVPATPAAFAAFEAGETIQKIGGKSVASWQDARWALLKYAVDQTPSLPVETITAQGNVTQRILNLSNISADELDGDFLNKIGFSSYQPAMKPVIAQVMKDGAAHSAGVMVGDEILAVNNDDIYDWIELVTVIRSNPEQSLTLDILRDKKVVKIVVTPELATENGNKIGKVGIAPQVNAAELEKLIVNVSYPAGVALLKAIDKTWDTTVLTLQMLVKMVTGDVSWKNISGPISIADYAGQSAQMGISSYIGFLALISISLGVLNLLPIPILDGGHLMYYVIEIVRGKPLPESVMLIGQQIGMTLLFTLMIFAIYNDIYRIISG
ncbi:MAG: RIP metalloprotease RseP [Nitrosomonas sp.]|nr:RIP metalloprotease RseP [Nitrosomonas sp.]MDP1951135.1 RIP metalloprotease RseP [Nitrosomonas sp.]